MEIHLGISCFLKVYSRATCSLQLYKCDSVTSVSSQMIFSPLCWENSCACWDNGRLLCGGLYSRTRQLIYMICHLEITNQLNLIASGRRNV